MRKKLKTIKKELKAEFEPYNLMLTAAVGATEQIVEAGYEIDKICR